MIIGLSVFILFTLVWYLPLLRKHQKSVTEPKQSFYEAFFMGVIATILAVVLNIGFTWLYGQITRLAMFQNQTLLAIAGFLHVLISIAMVEELLKFFLGRIVVKKIPDLSEAGCMLLFGMVGIGFGFMEELGVSDIVSGILNGVLEMHLCFQLVMGVFAWRAWEAKKKDDRAGYKKNLALAWLIPILVHGIYDYFLLTTVDIVDTNFDKALVLFAVAFAIGLINAIVSAIFAHKVVKKELRQTEAASH